MDRADAPAAPPAAPDHFSRFDPQILEAMHKELSDVLKMLEDELELLGLNWRDRQKLYRVMKIHTFQGSGSQLLEDENSPLSANQNLSSQMATLNELIEHRQEKIRLLGRDAEEKSALTLHTLSVALVKIQEDIKTWKASQNSCVFYERKKDIQDLENEQLSLRLDDIQRHCELLADSLLKLRSNLSVMDGFRRRMGDLNEYKMLACVFKSDRRSEAENLLKELVTASFIVEIQPPQVVKHSSRLPSIILRFLIGNTLSTNWLGQMVTASVVYEDDVQLQRDCVNGSDSSGDSSSLLNNTTTFKYVEHTKRVLATFKNLQIQRLRRQGREFRRPVFEEAFWFQFKTTVRISDLVLNVAVLSNPFVAITNTAQYTNASASIFWNHVLCNQHDSIAGWVFNMLEKVTWPVLAAELKKFFHDKTGCNLNDESLTCLKSKLYRELNVSDNDHIIGSKFYREILSHRNFTFWNWFQSAVGLFKLESNLKDLWNEGLVMGFVSRERTEELLKRCKAGTIILRFSDSCLGGLSVACISADRIVFNVAPFTSADLRQRGLINRLLDMNTFKFVYPNIPLEEKLALFVKPIDMTSEQINKQSHMSYIKPLMRTFLPGVTDSLGYLDSAPSPFPIPPPEHANSEAVFEEILEDISNWPDEADATSELSTLGPGSSISTVETVQLEALDDEFDDVMSAREQVFMNLDNQTITSAGSAVQSAEVSSNFPTMVCVDHVDWMESGTVLPSQDSTGTAADKLMATTAEGTLKATRRKVDAGFIMKKRDRDKSKSKRKKSLAKWAKDLTNTCGCRVFLMIENSILCDSLDGGRDAIELPDSVKHEFVRREPNSIPDEVLKRLFQNMHITKRASSSGIKRFKPSDSSSPSSSTDNSQPGAIENRRPSVDLSCRICDSVKDPLSQVVEMTTTVWLKCKTLVAQCNYYVHANCAGIYLSNQIEAQSIPFFCPSHLRELLRRT